jgi:predicted sugar kinase
MLLHATEITKEIEFLVRQAYPAARSDFAPTAYVVLTREKGIKPEKRRG